MTERGKELGLGEKINGGMRERILEQVRIVLVEPAGPLNVGAIARVMKNMGLQQLVVVAPRCDAKGEQARRMAVHAKEVLEGAEIVSSLGEAIADCRMVVGTVGRTQPMEFTVHAPRSLLPQVLTVGNFPLAIIFGPEDRGLNNQELGQCQQQMFIPTSEVYPSLNLAQAVGICAYELRQTALEDELSETLVTSNRPEDVVPTQVMDGFYGHLESVLLQVGFLLPHTTHKKMRKFRRLFDRAGLTLAEVGLLRGVLGQLSWADRNLPRQSQPKDT